MALVVGELTGVISLDADGVTRGLSQAERAMRAAGQSMGDDAERAGQRAGQQLGDGVADGLDGVQDDAAQAGRQAGEALGDGIVRGADGRLRNARGRFVAAGRAAGDAVGDGLADSGEEGADQAVGGMGEKLSKLKLAAAGAGAAAGAALMAAFTEAMDQSRVVGRLGAQLGKTPAEAQKYGKIAGELYAGAVTEDFQGAADAIRATMSSGLLPPAATNRQIREISTQVSDLASTFELDLGQAANAAGQMIKTGLARNGRHALDIMAKGLQGLGPRADDLADTFNEYSTIFRSMGLDGQTAMGLIRQGMLAGARDTDVVADAIKEFTIEAVAGGERVKKGFTSLGLSADDMVAKFAAGGPEAAAGLDTVLDKLRGIEDPAKRNAIAIELFGTKAEDLGDSLYALDPSEAVKELGEVGGAAEKMGNTLRDNAGAKLEQFKRGMQQNLVSFLGGTVVPAFLDLRRVAGNALGSMWEQAGQEADSSAIADRIVAFLPILGQRLAAKAREVAPHIISGLTNAGQAVAEYVMANPTAVFKAVAIAGALTIAIAALPALVALALSAAAVTMMIGFVGRLITALRENVPLWWASFTGWVSEKASQAGQTMNVLGAAIGIWFMGLWSRYVSGPVSRAWASFIASVQALPGRVRTALAGLGPALVTLAASAWSRFRDTTVQRVQSLVAWLRGLPGMISRGIGHLGSLLYGKGQDVVRGLLSGIQSMGGWLKGQLMGFARSMIPGPVAKALGIASPSKVMAKSVGRWIPRGIVAGIESTAGEVDRTMAGLVSTPTPSASYAGAVGSAVGAGAAAGGKARPSQVVRLDGGGELGDAIITLIRKRVGISGGDVQFVLGR